MQDEVDYSKIEIQDLIESFRNNPTRYINSLDISGFLGIIEDIIANEVPNSNRVEIDIAPDYSMRVIFDNLEGHVQNNWAKIAYCPTLIFNPSFMPLNAFCQSFTINRFEESHLRSVHKYEKGRLIEGTSNHILFDCSALEITFTLDQEIWEKSFDWREASIIEKMEGIASQYEDVSFEINGASKFE